MKPGLFGVAVLALALACACGGNKDSGGGAGKAPPPPPTPASACPGGSLPDASGKCVVVMTQPKVDAVKAQETRIDELGKLLDKVDTLGAPIELLDGIRQLDEWKKLAATSDKLKVVDDVVATLNTAVKQLRAFRGNLGELQARLHHLDTTLDELIAGTGMAKNLADARVEISTQVRALVTPYAQETSETIQRALAPLVAQLADVADLVRGACAMAKLSGGGDKLKDLCGKATDTFQQALTYLDGIKARPAAVFDELTNLLLAQLDQLIDEGTRAAIAAAQVQVDRALELPAAGSGSGH